MQVRRESADRDRRNATREFNFSSQSHEVALARRVPDTTICV